MNRTFIIGASAFLLISFAAAQTSAPTFLADPTQLVSRQKFDIQPFTVEKLYMTRAIAYAAWSPDDKQVAFVTNMPDAVAVPSISSLITGTTLARRLYCHSIGATI